MSIASYLNKVNNVHPSIIQDKYYSKNPQILFLIGSPEEGYNNVIPKVLLDYLFDKPRKFINKNREYEIKRKDIELGCIPEGKTHEKILLNELQICRINDRQLYNNITHVRLVNYLQHCNRFTAMYDRIAKMNESINVKLEKYTQLFENHRGRFDYYLINLLHEAIMMGNNIIFYITYKNIRFIQKKIIPLLLNKNYEITLVYVQTDEEIRQKNIHKMFNEQKIFIPIQNFKSKNLKKLLPYVSRVYIFNNDNLVCKNGYHSKLLPKSLNLFKDFSEIIYPMTHIIICIIVFLIMFYRSKKLNIS